MKNLPKKSLRKVGSGLRRYQEPPSDLDPDLRIDEGVTIKKLVKKLLRKVGYEIKQYQAFPPDFDPDSIKIIRQVAPYTMTGPERVFSLIEAVRYVVGAKIKGSIVECGVWRGGSMMAVASTLQLLKETSRELFLFDTYEGMPRPTIDDIFLGREDASLTFEQTKLTEDSSDWCRSPLDEVQANLRKTGYPAERMKFVRGKVEETIPGSAPEQIALLRLDTDFYESTRHELLHLYPRLSPGGILIVDDYGDWAGCRKAVNEYFAANGNPVFLSRVDSTGRITVKR